MKKIAAIIVLILVLAGGIFLLKTKEQEPLLNNYKCNINDVDHYIHNEVIYFLNKKGGEYIYTDFGVYQRKETKDGWILKFHQNKFKSIYVTVFDWIDKKEHPVAGKITCEAFTEFPEGFQVFIDTHGMIFKQIANDFKELE